MSYVTSRAVAFGEAKRCTRSFRISPASRARRSMSGAFKMNPSLHRFNKTRRKPNNRDFALSIGYSESCFHLHFIDSQGQSWFYPHMYVTAKAQRATVRTGKVLSRISVFLVLNRSSQLILTL